VISQPRPESVPAHPGASSDQASRRMSRAARVGTAPEMAIRKALHAQGLRYRVGLPVPGQRRRTIDVAFTRARIAVFVDGCFWHGCPKHGTWPKANSEWWRLKLAANRRRDQDTNRLLREQGWSVVRLWEHTSAPEAVDQVVRVLSAARADLGQR
jgi:DNA mismatch endonuclease (patch repair protein)